jgi:hypothetical protein
MPYLENFKHIEAPADWMKKLVSDSIEFDTAQTIIQFEEILVAAGIFNPAYVDTQSKGGYIEKQFIDLDGDQKEEILALIGWFMNEPTMIVLKEIDNTWYIIYVQPFIVHYQWPEILVSKQNINHKTFYIRCLYNRGSGIYRDAYHFYKLIDNNIFHVLELPKESKLYGWGLYINQSIDAELIFSENDDILFAVYNYKFFPGAIFEGDMSWDGHEDMAFVEGIDTVKFEFNNVLHRYQPKFDSKHNKLNAEKIACFGDFGNDSLFISAYANELNLALDTGSQELKTAINTYLDLYEKNSGQTVRTGKMVIKNNINGTIFYGIE